MKRFLIPLGLFFGLLVFLAVGLRLNPREIPSPFIGKAAPAFSLTQLHEADKMITPADMAGKVWVLNVWASWCTSCRVEHPVLMDFARTGQVPIVGLNYKDGRNEGRQWLSEHGNPYTVSAFDADGRVGIDYGVYGVPETFVIDKKGVIRMKFTGPLTREALAGKLLPLIEELNRA
ncbi:DsbE family thiol:disulfide interchange protein [Noviherbaspirillum aridicola]|uniref:Thiol:disulfide interchange protein n=1 Tax=Noviherbaspirillum aridicola TaxID=2849687 RepID=A0ABQ4Q6B8_9BURK|nr:DsbE family thiol:disulfide interchange protein [Noviherbaspirillum aridicola]GIZ52710.1 thiol:disulfide interchange protein [Noviherbaspirillum aridicola]